MSIVTVTAGVLAANGISVWIAAMMWRLKRDPKDFSALVQVCALLMAACLVFVAAAQQLPDFR